MGKPTASTSPQSWNMVFGNLVFGNYVAKPAFFLRGLRALNFVLDPNPER
jgi:hypothetical protein